VGVYGRGHWRSLHVENQNEQCRISQPSRNATLVARQPRGIQAYAPIERLTASYQTSAKKVMRENKAKKSGVVDRTEEMKLMRSMKPEQRKAYLANAGLTCKFDVRWKKIFTSPTSPTSPPPCASCTAKLQKPQFTKFRGTLNPPSLRVRHF